MKLVDKYGVKEDKQLTYLFNNYLDVEAVGCSAVRGATGYQGLCVRPLVIEMATRQNPLLDGGCTIRG
jgi:hypothetical protein